MASRRRAFVLRHTRLQPVPDLDSIVLHLADEVLPLWHAIQVETDDPDAALPYWAFAWGGGLALARYLAAEPGAVRSRRVLDLAAGSGLCGIAALRAGAEDVIAAEIDPYAAAAIELNARANRRRVRVVEDDLLDGEPPDVDLILAGDCFYEARLGDRVMAWLRRARGAGIDVLIGDPGRRYLPLAELDEIAAFDVRTTTELEDLALKRGHVFRVR